MPCEPALSGGSGGEHHRGHLAQLAFHWHRRIYFLVTLFLVAIWRITSEVGHYWPIWTIWTILPIVGWRLGPSVQGIATDSLPDRSQRSTG